MKEPKATEFNFSNKNEEYSSFLITVGLEILGERTNMCYVLFKKEHFLFE